MANSIWKHQHILRDLEDGLPYLSILYGLVYAGAIRVVQPDAELVRKSYTLATRYEASTHDTIFVSLALEVGVKLKTFDKQQSKIMRLEGERGAGP